MSTEKEDDSLMGIEDARKRGATNKWLVVGIFVAVIAAVVFGAGWANCESKSSSSCTNTAQSLIVRYFTFKLAEYPQFYTASATAASISYLYSSAQDFPVQTPSGTPGSSYRIFAWDALIDGGFFINTGAYLTAGKNGTGTAHFWEQTVFGENESAILLRPDSYHDNLTLVTTAGIQLNGQVFIWWELLNTYLDLSPDGYGVSTANVTDNVDTMFMLSTVEYDFTQRWWPATAHLFPNDGTGPFQSLVGKYVYSFSECPNAFGAVGYDNYCLARWPASQTSSATPAYEWFNGKYTSAADAASLDASFDVSSQDVSPIVFRAGSDISIEYNPFLQQWVNLYVTEGTRKIMMRTSKQLWDTWSDEFVLYDGTTTESTKPFQGACLHSTMFEDDGRIMYFSYTVNGDTQMPRLVRIELNWS